MTPEIKQTPESSRVEVRQMRGMHPAWYLAIAVALAGNVGLYLHSRSLAKSLTDLQATTQAQMAQINDQIAAKSAASEERLASMTKEAQDSLASAQTKALNESRRNAAAFSTKLAEARRQQQQVAGDLDQLKLSSNETTVKVDQINGDLNGVKGDLASTKTDIEGHSADLRRVNGDMGVMSGAIATNAKELAALRELGERNYTEFNLKRKSPAKNISGIQLALTKADPKRNRFTLDVRADDKRVEKRDRTVNEPVQLYVSGYRQPVEIVVNQVNKDEVVGYVAMPKVGGARK
jgi:chromosome segregation ATPase